MDERTKETQALVYKTNHKNQHSIPIFIFFPSHNTPCAIVFDTLPINTFLSLIPIPHTKLKNIQIFKPHLKVTNIPF